MHAKWLQLQSYGVLLSFEREGRGGMRYCQRVFAERGVGIYLFARSLHFHQLKVAGLRNCNIKATTSLLHLNDCDCGGIEASPAI
jgi:hypothetical protein